MHTRKQQISKKNFFSRFLCFLVFFSLLFDCSVSPAIVFGREAEASTITRGQKLSPSAEDLDNMMKKLLDPGLPSIEKKRITGILFYHQPAYRNAVSHGKFSANSPQVKAFLEQKKIMQADVIQRMGINYKNKYGKVPKQPIIPFDYNDIFSDDDIITGTGETGRRLEPLYNDALNEVMQETVGRPMSASMRKKVDVNGLAWNMTQDAAHLDFAHDEKYINPQSGHANQRKLIEGAKKGKVTVYTFDDNGRIVKLSPEDSIEEIKRLAVGKTLDIPGIDATRGSGSMSDFLRMAEKHKIRPRGRVTVEEIQQFVRNQKYSQRVIGDYNDIFEANAKLSKQYDEFIELSNKLRGAKTIKAVASLLGSRYGIKILLPGGMVDYDKLTEAMLKHQNKQLTMVLPDMIAEVSKTEAYKIVKYLKTAGKSGRLKLRKQMALTYAPMKDDAIETITKRIDKMSIDAADKNFIKSVIKNDSRQIRRYAELLQIPTDELAARLKIDGDNIACTKWISSTTRYKPFMDAVISRSGGSRFAAFLESKTAKALNLDTMLSPKASASSKFMLYSMMTLAATRAYNASGSGEEGLKAVATTMFEMIPFTASVLRFSEGEGKQAFKEFCMDVMPPVALANVAVMVFNYVAEAEKTAFTESIKDDIARQVLKDLTDDDFIESDVPDYYRLKDREGMLQYLDDVSPGLGRIAKLASMIEPEIDALMSRNSEVDINNKAISTLQWFETVSVGPYEATFGKMFDLEQLKARVYETGVPAINELPPVQRVAAKLIVDNLRIRKELYYEVIARFMDRIEKLYNDGKEDGDEEWVQIVTQAMEIVKALYNNAPRKIHDSVFGSDKLKEEYRGIIEYLTAYNGEGKDLFELRKEMQEIIDNFREFIQKLGIAVDIEMEGKYIDLRGHIFGGTREFDEGNTVILGDCFRIGISARVSPIRKNLPWTVYYYMFNEESEKMDKIADIKLKSSQFNPGNEGLWPIDNPEKTTFFAFDKKASKKYFPEEKTYKIYPVIAFGSWSNPMAEVGFAALANPADYPGFFSEERAAFIGASMELSMVRPIIYADIERNINKNKTADLKIALHIPPYAQYDEHKVEITSFSYVEGSNAPVISPDSHKPVSADAQVPPKNPSISSVSFDRYAEEGTYEVTIEAKIKGLDKDYQPHSKTIILNYIDPDGEDENDEDVNGDLAELVSKAATLSSEVSISCQESGEILAKIQTKLDSVKIELKELENKVKRYEIIGRKSNQNVMDIDNAHARIETLTVDIGNISTEFDNLANYVCEQTRLLKQVNTNAQRDSVCSNIFPQEPIARNLYQGSKDAYKEIKEKKKQAEDILKALVEAKKGIDSIDNLDKLIETVNGCEQELNIAADKLSVAKQKIEELAGVKEEARVLTKGLKQLLKPIRKTEKGIKAIEQINASLSQIYESYSSAKKCPAEYEKKKRRISKIIKNYNKRLPIIKEKLQKLYDIFGKPGIDGDQFAGAKEKISLIDLLKGMASKNYVPRIARSSIDADACFDIAHSLKNKMISYVLPNYRGAPITAAVGDLERFGIAVNAVEEEDAPNPALEYAVKSQVPGAGTEVKIVDASITLRHYGKLDVEAYEAYLEAQRIKKGQELEARMNYLANQVPRVNMAQVDALFNQSQQIGWNLSQSTLNALNAAADRQRKEDQIRAEQAEEQRRQNAIRNQQQQQALTDFFGQILTQMQEGQNQNNNNLFPNNAFFNNTSLPNNGVGIKLTQRTIVAYWNVTGRHPNGATTSGYTEFLANGSYRYKLTDIQPKGKTRTDQGTGNWTLNQDSFKMTFDRGGEFSGNVNGDASAFTLSVSNNGWSLTFRRR